jgi:MFS family permease
MDPGEAAAATETPARVGRGFLAGFVLAQIGAYVSFLPLLQILVPLQAAALSPTHKAELVAAVSFCGAAVAALSNLAAGWISDRTRWRWGRRRPWIVVGAVATAASYALIAVAASPMALLLAVLVYQLCFNIAFAPLLALIPDRVPDDQKGWVSALAGLGMPIGSAVGSLVVGMALHGRAERFGALAAMVLVTLVPFALLIRDPLPATLPPRSADAPRTGFSRDFAFVWLSRCLVLTAFSLGQIYLLFYLQETLGYGPGRGGGPEADVARLAVVFGAADAMAGLLAGRASDRLGRRKGFVVAGAIGMAAGMGGVALAGGWAQALLSYAVLGVGAGIYYAVDLALIAQVLPSARNVGRDLGLFNLSNTLPQVAAPALAGLLLAHPGASTREVFALAAGLAVAGAVVVAPVRRVR